MKKFFLCLLFGTACAYGSSTDSLKGKSYAYLIAKLESDNIPRETLVAYAKAYLVKAKSETNWRETANAYKVMLNLSQKELKVAYADSMLAASKQTRDNTLVGASYLSRGMAYYVIKQHARALDNYLLADRYLAKTDDQYMLNKVKFNIAQIKYYLGFYHEAISLFKGCIKYYRNEDDVPYLISLHGVGLCYNRLGKYDACSTINDRGIKEAARLKHPEAVARFLHSEGVNQYFKENYKKSVSLLTQAMPAMVKADDFANEAVADFYMGKSYWHLGDTQEAITFFTKVDTIFQKHGYLRPDMREGYELLIRHFKRKGDVSRQLLYIEQLLKADKSLNANYKYLSGKIHREYDTQKLLCAKAELEQSFNETKRHDALIIAVLAAAVASLFFWQARTRRRNRKKFDELMSRITAAKPAGQKPSGTLDINPDVVDAVLKNLEKFEAGQKYLKPDLTQSKLAQMFGSNTKYVARIIQHYKGKKSIDYVNGLRIDYITGRLRAESKLRNYTQQALAEEAGFSTAQHFTRAFLSKNEISVSYYISQLDKDAKTNQAVVK